MNSFRLQNIKAFVDTGEIELKPVTIFVGKNISGKSSLIRFLVLLKQSLMVNTLSPIHFDGEWVDYGNFEDVIHNNVGDTMSFEFSYQFKGYKFTNSYVIVKKEKRVFIKEFKALCNNTLFLSLLHQRTDYYQITFYPGTLTELKDPLSFESKVLFKRFILPFEVFTDITEKYIRNKNFGTLIMPISLYLERVIENIIYIGPFRTPPSRSYRNSESVFDYVGTSGEHTHNLLNQSHKFETPLIGKVSNWFEESLGLKVVLEEVSESEFFKIKIKPNYKSTSENIIDVGYGISQTLPIVTQLYYERPDERSETTKTYIIEQPELHLHPNAQAALANLFVNRIQDKKSKILVETHSEHLITRLQSLIADPDTQFDAEDLAIYYVDMDNNGESSVMRMYINEYGQFEKKFPTGFFDKGYELNMDILKNAAKRKKK